MLKMGANKSNTEENNKDEIWYGWIPKLSHEMIVPSNGMENKFFDEVAEDDLEEVFKDEDVLLSDKLVDRFLKNKHHVKFSDHKIISCECCKEKVWSVTVEIKGKNKDLIKGTAEIHKNGLVRYKIIFNEVKGKHSTNKAQDIHKIIRDHFHFHLYHSSDMPLPPVKVDEECNEDLAKEKILRKFLDAFIEFKRRVNKVMLAKAEEDLSRALGEIVYANSALDKFSEKEKYLFSFDDMVEGNERFKKFLKDELKIRWAENAEIKKTNDETITVVDKNDNTNLIIIKINKPEKIINLEIVGRRTYKYILKEENGKLNIYKEKNYEEFRKSFENFNESFKLLLQRTTNQRSQRVMVNLTVIIAIFAFIQLFIQLLNSFSFPYSDELIKLSLLPLTFLILYVIAEIYKLRDAPK